MTKGSGKLGKAALSAMASQSPVGRAFKEMSNSRSVPKNGHQQTGESHEARRRIRHSPKMTPSSKPRKTSNPPPITMHSKLACSSKDSRRA
ncbi:hypothetical protein QYZ46_26115 [Vibrio parahaemolyticus]|nr:hypothetical protein [Vibrio parahaemolyticus]